MNTGPNTGKNRKKVLIVGRMPEAGIAVLKARDDVDYEILTDDRVPSLHPKLKDANAVTLGATPFRQAELDAAPGMMVVARLGVGFDAVEIPALNKRKIPLMTTGIANSVSVAEHAMYMMLAASRLTKKSDRWVRTGAWAERLSDLPSDVAGKKVRIAREGTLSDDGAAARWADALDRGNRCPVDVMGGIDHFALAPMPLEDARIRLGVAPKGVPDPA